jgi:hypothetical protein
MSAFTGAGSLDRCDHPKPVTGCSDRDDVRAPAAAVEVDRQKPARVVGEQRIDAHHVSSPKVGKQLGFGHGAKRLVWALPAPGAWLAADISPPLVPATWRPPALALRAILPTKREHVAAAAEETREAGDLEIRPHRARHDVGCPPGELRRLIPLGAQSGDVSSGGPALNRELAESRLCGGDRGVELCLRGHGPILPLRPARMARCGARTPHTTIPSLRTGGTTNRPSRRFPGAQPRLCKRPRRGGHEFTLGRDPNPIGPDIVGWDQLERVPITPVTRNTYAFAGPS